jgi:hypothetical protein
MQLFSLVSSDNDDDASDPPILGSDDIRDERASQGKDWVLPTRHTQKTYFI